MAGKKKNFSSQSQKATKRGLRNYHTHRIGKGDTHNSRHTERRDIPNLTFRFVEEERGTLNSIATEKKHKINELGKWLQGTNSQKAVIYTRGRTQNGKAPLAVVKIGGGGKHHSDEYAKRRKTPQG